MSAIADLIESVKRIDSILENADLEPRAEREDWPSAKKVGSSRVDLQACKLEYSIVSPK